MINNQDNIIKQMIDYVVNLGSILLLGSVKSLENDMPNVMFGGIILTFVARLNALWKGLVNKYEGRMYRKREFTKCRIREDKRRHRSC